MLNLVREQRPTYNNQSSITSHTTISNMKLTYYKVFAWCYGITGYTVDILIVNSTWTENHMKYMWSHALNKQWSLFKWFIRFVTTDKMKKNSNTTNGYSNTRLLKIFPPCNSTHLQAISLTSNSEKLSNALKLCFGEESIKWLQVLEVQSSNSKTSTGPSATPLPVLSIYQQGSSRARIILSLGQFRPEKDHMLQIE